MPAADLLWEGSLFFDPADPAYRDHFPGHPIVPGSLMVAGCLAAAREAGIATAGMTLKNVAFRSFLTPGTYACRLERRGDGVAFSVADGETVAATGSLAP